MKHPIGYTHRLAMVALAAAAAAIALPALAADMTVNMKKATQDGTGESVGTIIVASSSAGATFKLDLHGLLPGPHGFHVHENANCGPTLLNDTRIPAGSAGGHLDPDHTSKHQGPTGEGHFGDLPVLTVDANGAATATLTAPRIKDVAALKGHALMIHAGGDNYSDTPAALGGGGARFACGLIE